MRSEGLLWTVVVSNSNSAGCDAVIDSSATIWDGTNFSTGNARSVGATRRDVLWAAWAKLVVTSWRITIVARGAAVFTRIVSQNVYAGKGGWTYSLLESSIHLRRKTQRQYRTGGRPAWP